jgi:hypothetical protein
LKSVSFFIGCRKSGFGTKQRNFVGKECGNR